MQLAPLPPSQANGWGEPGNLNSHPWGKSQYITQITQGIRFEESHCVHIPYSGKFSLVQIFAEKRRVQTRLFRRNFRGFQYFRGCGTLWPHLYQLMATPHMRTEETTLNDEAKKQARATTA